ncbi:hypothetical protein ACFVYG_33410 [Streptomyces sp. NPDC058256]|uniref:hypothetical protein n=1 Tax=Streptomyces sp. NPDC058256 TaxID=3346408 RepID=UPI0036E7D306
MDGTSVVALSAALTFVGAAASALGSSLATRYLRRDRRLRKMQRSVAASVSGVRELTDEERERIRQFLARERDEADTEEWWVVGEPPGNGDRRDG